LYVTSGANPGNTEKAKTIIIYAIIGVVVALLASAVVPFICSVLVANCPAY
jgi:hypothetical protein